MEYILYFNIVPVYNKIKSGKVKWGKHESS